MASDWPTAAKQPARNQRKSIGPGYLVPDSVQRSFSLRLRARAASTLLGGLFGRPTLQMGALNSRVSYILYYTKNALKNTVC